MNRDEMIEFRLKLRHELEAFDEDVQALVGDGPWPAGPFRSVEAHLSEQILTAAALLHRLRREQWR